MIDREKIQQTAQGFVQKKRYDLALAEYQKIVQQEPGDVKTLLKIGDLQSKTDAFADAVATYEKVGQHYATQGSPLKAIAVFKQILEIVNKHIPSNDGRYDHIALKLAPLYVELGLVSDALAMYDEAATRLQRAGRDMQAVEVFRKIVELDKTNPLPYLRLAEAYSHAKDAAAATEHFATAAEILVRLGRRADALKVLERLLHHNKGEPRFASQAAELYLDRGGPNDGMLALAKLQICFQADPKNLVTLGLLARAFVAIGQPTKAVEVDKELARLAKEQNSLEIYRAAIERLLATAPNDEAVKKLAASMAPGSLADQDRAGAAVQAPAPASPVVVSSPVATASPVAPRPPPPVPRAGAPAPLPLKMPAIPVVETISSGPPVSYSDVDVEELSYDDIQSDPSASRQPSPPATANKSARSSRPAGAGNAGPQAMVPPGAYRGKMVTESPELEVRESMLDAEEVGAGPGAADPRRVLLEAESFEKLGLLDRAVARLAAGIEVSERSLPLRAKLRDLLLAMNDGANAAEQMVAVAVLAYESGDLATSVDQLYAALDLAPGHDGASQMLIGLGYDPTSAAPGDGGDSRGSHSSLPSYDLEEMGANEALSGPPAQSSMGGDDGSPLPSFPIDDDEPLALPLARRRGPSPETIEEALEETEFFLSRALFDDARAIVNEQLQRSPSHPLLIERLREIDAAAAAHAGSGTRALPGGRSLFPGPGGRAFDITASLNALDALDAGSRGESVAGTRVNAEEIFTQFKAGVREQQVDDTDSATHYDLGLAYREMGLIADALTEFEIAARDPERACICLSMIGMVHRSQGNDAGAIDAFLKGLDVDEKTPEQELGLFYELGDTYAAKGDNDEALGYFREVAARHATFSDPRGKVSERIAALSSGQKRTTGKQVVGSAKKNEEDVDDAFDAMMGNRK